MSNPYEGDSTTSLPGIKGTNTTTGEESDEPQTATVRSTVTETDPSRKAADLRTEFDSPTFVVASAASFDRDLALRGGLPRQAALGHRRATARPCSAPRRRAYPGTSSRHRLRHGRERPLLRQPRNRRHWPRRVRRRDHPRAGQSPRTGTIGTFHPRRCAGTRRAGGDVRHRHRQRATARVLRPGDAAGDPRHPRPTSSFRPVLADVFQRTRHAPRAAQAHQAAHRHPFQGRLADPKHRASAVQSDLRTGPRRRRQGRGRLAGGHRTAVTCHYRNERIHERAGK